jgi:protein-L-isoaspartate(D-aspartate) O-methyltransferase
MSANPRLASQAKSSASTPRQLARHLLALLLGLSTALCGGRVPAAEIDYVAARTRMVEEQLASTRRGISDPTVLKAMATVPRHEFVPPELKPYAYDDRPLPIGYAQTISQPYVVAFMTEKLQPKSTDRVLEIGTGSGYQAAVLSLLTSEVYSIEIIEPLARRAASDLSRLGYDNVKLRYGDGYQGWPEAAPFDGIIVTCAPDHVPKPLIDQLRDGGRMIIPVGERGDQMLYLLKKHGSTLQREAVLPVRFVPMTGATDERFRR